MNSLFETARKIDLFGKLYIFEEKDHQKFTTVLGTLLTFIIIITCIVIGFLFGQEVYQRKNPTVLNSTEKIDFSRINLSEFPIFFAIVNGPSVNQPTAPDYIKMEMTQIEFDKNFSPTVSYYSGYKQCSVSDYSELYQPYVQTIYNSIGLSFDLYCIKYNNDLYIQNDYSAASSSYLNVRFSLCDETLNQCGDDLSERDRLISDLYVVSLYVDSYIDSSNYENPKKYYSVTNPIKVSEGLLQRHFYNIQKINFIDHKGWMLEDKISEDVLSIKSISKEVSAAYNNNLLWVTLSSPNIRSRIERSYMKIQDTLAKIGGFFNALFIIILILSKNYVDFSFYKYIYSQFSQIKNNGSDMSRKKIGRKQTIDDVVVKLAYSNLQNSVRGDKSLYSSKNISNNKDDHKQDLFKKEVETKSPYLNYNNQDDLRKGFTSNTIQDNQFAQNNFNKTNNNINIEERILNNLNEKDNSKVNINNYIVDLKKQDSNNNFNNNINNKCRDNSINNSKIQFKTKEVEKNIIQDLNNIKSTNNILSNNIRNIPRIIPEEIHLIKNYTENISYFKYLIYDVFCCKNKFTYQRKAVAKVISFDNIMEVSYNHFIKHELNENINDNNSQ